MSSYLTLGHISNEVADVFENELVLAKHVNRDYDDTFAKTGAKIGDTANLRLPGRHLVQHGAQFVAGDDDETSTPIRITTHDHIGLQYTQVDRLLSMDQFSERFIRPRVAAMANEVDLNGFKLYKQIWNQVGTAGVVPASSTPYLSAGVKLDNEASPQDENRTAAITSQMRATLIASEQALFHRGEEIARQHRKARIGEEHGFHFYMGQNVATHRVGTYAGTILVDGANQSGASLLTKGHTSGTSTVNEGDTFTIAGVYHVNPQSRMSVGILQDFVIKQTVLDVSGAATWTFDPPLIASGKDQTVDALPADSAAITINGVANTQSPQGLAFHRDAFVLAMVDLPMPGAGASFRRVTSKKSGVSMTMAEQFDIKSYTTIMRIDILYGWAVYRPQLACRIYS